MVMNWRPHLSFLCSLRSLIYFNRSSLLDFAYPQDMFCPESCCSDRLLGPQTHNRDAAAVKTPLRQQSMQLTVDCSRNSDQSHTALMPTYTNLRRVPICSEQMCSLKKKRLLNQKHKSWSPTDRIQTESNKTEAWFV